MVLRKDLVVSAIRGAFIADAASLGTHWIYDPQEMKQAVPSIAKPEFKTPPQPKYYSSEEFPNHYGPGMLSPYGEQMLFVTEYVASNLGTFDGQDLSDKFYDWITNTYTGRKDSAMNNLIENVKEQDMTYPNAGADDYQAHCFMKVIPVTCLYAGKPELQEKVKEAILIHQNNEKAIGFGLASSYILEHVLLHNKLPDNIDSVIESISNEEVKSQMDYAWKKATTYSKDDFESLLSGLGKDLMPGQEDSPYYKVIGRSCALPGAFLAPIYLLLQVTTTTNNSDNENLLQEARYMDLVRANILGAGDTCSRAILLGALLGAHVNGGPPQEWIDQMDPKTMERIDAAANKIGDHIANSSNTNEL